MRILGLLMGLSLMPFVANAQTLVGVIYPDNDLTLALGVSGPVSQLPVKQGSLVKQGDLILSLHSEVERLEVLRREVVWKDQSELNGIEERLAITQPQYRAAKELYEQSQSISKDELARLEIELINTQVKLKQLQTQEKRQKIEYQQSKEDLLSKRLLAPITGVVTQVAVQQGEWVKAGEPVVQVVDVSKVFLKLNVSDKVSRNLTLKQGVDVNVEGVGARQGFIDYISPIADAASGLVEVKVVLQNKDLSIRPGTKASVEW